MVPNEGSIAAESGSSVLLNAARPDVFRTNGFRITGLPVDASAQVVTRRVDRLRMGGKYGGASLNGNGPLPLDPPPDADLLRTAIQRLRDPEIRLLDEFFWFWPQKFGSSSEDEALNALVRGEEKEAFAIWTGQEKHPETSDVALHNLAVLLHAKALDMEVQRHTHSDSSAAAASLAQFWAGALQRWRELISAEGFWSRLSLRIGEMQDPRLTANTAQCMRESLPFALLLINAQLAGRAAQGGDPKEAQRHVALMKGAGFGDEVVQKSLRQVAEPLQQLVTTMCEAAEKEADADPRHADAVTKRLLEESAPLLAAFDSLLPPGDTVRDGVHDQVALRALTCQILFGNKTENWRTSLELLEKVMPIAAGGAARTRIDENLRTVRGNKEFGTCFFCEEKPPVSNQEASVPMHGNVQSFRVGYNTTRTTWKHNTFKVPRCGDCARAHSRAASARTVGRFLAFLSVVAFFFSIQWWGEYLEGQDAAGWYMFFWAVVAFITPLYLWRAVGRVLLKGRAAEEKKFEFRTIQEQKKQGWRFGQSPSARSAITRYKPDRGKWLADWQPFRRWVEGKQPIFVSMAALWIPIPLILSLIPLLWGFAVGTPASTRDLYRIGILSKSGAAERFSDAAADKRQNLQFRAHALKELSAILPSADPAARSAAACLNLRSIVFGTDPVSLGLRVVASDLLLKVSPQTAVDILTSELASPDPTLGRYAAEKLRDMGPAARNATASLEGAMGSVNSAVQEAAAQALSKIAPEEAVSRLVANLRSNDVQVRQRAAALLRDIGPPARAAIPTLVKARRDSDIQVRETASAALQAIDPTGHPLRREASAASSYSAGNSSSAPQETLPPGTYRVPLSESFGLNIQSAGIDLERSQVNELTNELNRLGREVNDERAAYNILVNEVNQLAGQLNAESRTLDRTSQFAVDNYNTTVRNYNASLQQLRAQQQRVNQAVDNYNVQLEQVKSERQRLHESIDGYNRKLHSVGKR